MNYPQDRQKKVSVVVPVYGSPNSIRPLSQRVNKVAQQSFLDIELVLVNDSCPKASWLEILAAHNEFENVVGVNLSRNFGQQYAIMAGLHAVSDNTDFIVVMDCDLQDRPEDIPKLIDAIIKNDCDICITRTNTRHKKSALRRFTSSAFYKVYGKLTKNQHVSNCSFFAFSRRAYDALLSFPESKVVVLNLVTAIGFQTCLLDVVCDERVEGRSSYTFRKRLMMALESITGASTVLLRSGIATGIAISILSLAYGAYQVVRYFLLGQLVQGWTSTIVILSLVSGLILTTQGIIGLYLETIFWEAKRRPNFIIQETLRAKKSRAS